MSLLTKRFPTILGLFFLVVIVVGIFFYYSNTKAIKVSNEIVPTKVRITNVADNKFSVSWVTAGSTTGEIEYGLVGEKLTTKAKDDRDTSSKGTFQTHHVTVEGLQPSTQYAFRILTGDKPTRFDNSGSPYTVATGPVIGATPSSQNFYGNVVLSSKQPAEGALVYISFPGAAPASAVVREGGNYAFTLSTLRSSDNRSYITYDPSASIASITVESGKLQSIVSASLANSAPVPPITLGQNAEFLSQPQKAEIAQVVPAEVQQPTSETKAETPSIFNVEPLVPESANINAVSTGAVTILNPKEVGEVLKTLRPEFRGTGPAGTTLSIALKGQKAISDTIQVASDGTWTWAPVIDLKTGKQTITVSYLPSGGTTQKVEREFSISTSTTGLDPAFVSSPSASVKTTAQASSSPVSSSSATPRVTMPNTDEGTPVTGVIENTLLTGALGLVIMVVGAVLLAL